MDEQKHYLKYQSTPIQAACNPLLTPSEKLIFATIYGLSSGDYNKPCWASNEYIAEYNQVTTSTVEKAIKKLTDLKYISRFTKSVIVKKGLGKLKNRYKKQRHIYTIMHPMWHSFSDLWNEAFPLKNKKAREQWYCVINALEKYKNVSSNIKYFEQIQEVITNVGGTRIKMWLDQAQTYATTLDKITVIYSKRDVGKIIRVNKQPSDGDGLNGKGVNHLLPKEHKPIEPKRKRYPKHIKPDQFDKWWVHYPKKAQKGKAKTAWNKLCSKKPKTDTPSLPQIVKATKKQKKTKQWIKSNGTFIPYPSTYLNNMRWLDDIDEMNKEYEYNQKNPNQQDLHAPNAVRAEPNKYKEPTDIRY